LAVNGNFMLLVLALRLADKAVRAPRETNGMAAIFRGSYVAAAKLRAFFVKQLTRYAKPERRRRGKLEA
jgi:hypothetical protein